MGYRFIWKSLTTAFCFLFFATTTQAFDVNNNHTGSYLYIMGGIQDVSNDTNVRVTPNQEFGNDIEPSMGLTYGYNITNWIAPELQFSYVTATGSTPGGSAREHALTIRLNGKYSFLTNSSFNANRKIKIYPYAKAGGLAHAVYVNAPVTDDKVGAWGYGFDLGGGVEFNWKALYLGLDISNDFVFLKEYTRNITGVGETVILNGGFDYQIGAVAAVGVHF